MMEAVLGAIMRATAFTQLVDSEVELIIIAANEGEAISDMRQQRLKTQPSLPRHLKCRL